MFTLWLAATTKLALAGPLRLLTFDPDGIPSGFTRSDSPAGNGDTAGFAGLLTDAVRPPETTT